MLQRHTAQRPAAGNERGLGGALARAQQHRASRLDGSLGDREDPGDRTQPAVEGQLADCGYLIHQPLVDSAVARQHRECDR